MWRTGTGGVPDVTVAGSLANCLRADGRTPLGGVGRRDLVGDREELELVRAR